MTETFNLKENDSLPAELSFVSVWVVVRTRWLQNATRIWGLWFGVPIFRNKGRTIHKKCCPVDVMVRNSLDLAVVICRGGHHNKAYGV